jgi:hypothetical protein
MYPLSQITSVCIWDMAVRSGMAGPTRSCLILLRSSIGCFWSLVCSISCFIRSPGRVPPSFCGLHFTRDPDYNVRASNIDIYKLVHFNDSLQSVQTGFRVMLFNNQANRDVRNGQRSEETVINQSTGSDQRHTGTFNAQGSQILRYSCPLLGHISSITSK